MKVILPLLGCFACCASAFGQLKHSPPAAIGLSEVKLEAITRHLQGEVDAGRIAGAVGLVARHGKIGYFEAVGESDLEAGTAMTTDSLFRIASMTKAITTVAVMMLVEEGAVILEEPIENYLPEFANLQVLQESEATVAANCKPTIHHLLTHTSGIGYGWFGPAAQDAAYRDADIPDILIPVEEPLANRISRLGGLPLAFQPGEQWAYGLSLDVLGRLVEVVSGLTLEQFFRERIFRPLKMRDTHFYVPDSKLGRLAELYTPNESQTKLERVGSEIKEVGAIRFSADFCKSRKGNLFAGGSGLVSSTLDYAHFLQALLNGGRPLLQTTTLDQMTSNQIGDMIIPFPGHGDGFGYGFGILTERGTANDVANVGTFSWAGIFNTYYWVDPQEQLIGILMTQVFPNDHLNIRKEFKRLAYEAIDDSGFSRIYWYQKGVEHGNPFFNSRQLRVNAADVSTHPVYSQRSEPRSSGMARILIEEDLRAIKSAKLYCEIWGGHSGTANKRVNINGRNLLHFPDLGTAANNCTHEYPSFSLVPSDLVNGYNSLQFACEDRTTFWGHYIVDNASLKIGLSPKAAGFEGFTASVVTVPDNASETITLKVESSAQAQIASVHFQGHYFGYDENGNGRATDWHGMTKGREPYAMLGGASESPFVLNWDTTMIPAQTSVAVKAYIRFKGHPELLYETPVMRQLEIVEKLNRQVSIHHAEKLPNPFASRAGKKIKCNILLDVEPAYIERAELNIATWTAESGGVSDYFTLNGHHFAVADAKDGHQVNYVTLPVDPELLRKGSNEIVLHSDSKHHAIEVFLPGPALIIRSRTD